MRLTYTPEGAESKSWPIEPDEMDSLTIEAIEDATDWTFAEWADRLERGSVKALRALLWVFLRESSPDLPFDSVVFKPAEIDVIDDEPKKAKKSGKA